MLIKGYLHRIKVRGLNGFKYVECLFVQHIENFKNDLLLRHFYSLYKN